MFKKHEMTLWVILTNGAMLYLVNGWDFLSHATIQIL